MTYPKHLSEKIRQEVAISYLKHELRKIFPSIKSKEVDNLVNCSELAQPRDFWNGLHGISMGFKLKNVLYLVTAENVSWRYKRIQVDQLNFGVELSCTKLIKTGKISALEFIDFYRKNSAERKKQLKVIEKIRGNDEIRENDPIIAIEKEVEGEKKIFVHDGNGRLARHLLENKTKIDAYIGEMKGDKPSNYWLPTSLLVDVLYYAYKSHDITKFVEVLNEMLSSSKSGRYEFWERALTSDKEQRKKFEKIVK